VHVQETQKKKHKNNKRIAQYKAIKYIIQKFLEVCVRGLTLSFYWEYADNMFMYGENDSLLISKICMAHFFFLIFFSMNGLNIIDSH